MLEDSEKNKHYHHNHTHKIPEIIKTVDFGGLREQIQANATLLLPNVVKDCKRAGMEQPFIIATGCVPPPKSSFMRSLRSWRWTATLFRADSREALVVGLQARDAHDALDNLLGTLSQEIAKESLLFEMQEVSNHSGGVFEREYVGQLGRWLRR